MGFETTVPTFEVKVRTSFGSMATAQLTYKNHENGGHFGNKLEENLLLSGGIKRGAKECTPTEY
jgi:hypothetical protein